MTKESIKSAKWLDRARESLLQADTIAQEMQADVLRDKDNSAFKYVLSQGSLMLHTSAGNVLHEAERALMIAEAGSPIWTAAWKATGVASTIHARMRAILAEIAYSATACYGQDATDVN